MRISFDLDGTLFVTNPLYAEPMQFNFVERDKVARLRKGTRELLAALAGRGWEIWLYTNSLRSPKSLWAWAYRLNLPVRDPAHIVNQQIHENRCAEFGLLPSCVPEKIPGWFAIDLHVDDSPAIVRRITETRGRACLIDEDDPEWADKVLACAGSLQGGTP